MDLLLVAVLLVATLLFLLGPLLAVDSEGTPRSVRLALALALTTPLIAGVAYWRTVDPTPAEATIGNQAAALAELPPAQQQAMIEGMVAALAARLAETPDDAEGWLRLGRSYLTLERWSEAQAAYQRATALLGEAPGVLLLQARAVRGAAGGAVSAEADRLTARALARDPENLEALWFSALAAQRAGDRHGAEALFARAIATLPQDSEEAAALRQRRDEILKTMP